MAGEEDEDKPQPPTETQLEQSVDPDQAVFAEQAIHHYLNWVLDPVREALVDAIDGFAAHLASMADAKAFDSIAFFEKMGKTLLHDVVDLFGGAHAPLGAIMHRELDGAIDMAARQEAQASLFLHEIGRAVRDACWLIRDNLQSILSHHWDQLRDLAYEGSTDFIPVLHHLGLPQVDTDGKHLTAHLTKDAEHYQQSLPKQKEEAAKDVPEDTQKEEADQAQAQFQEEEGQKQAI